jgi:hypothetical protein
MGDERAQIATSVSPTPQAAAPQGYRAKFPRRRVIVWRSRAVLVLGGLFDVWIGSKYDRLNWI